MGKSSWILRWSVVLGVWCVGLVGASVLRRAIRIADNEATGQSYTSTPSAPPTIYDAADAISRTLEIFPSGHSPHSAEARLISYYTMEVWLGSYGPTEPTPEVQDFPWIETAPDAPVWLVGVLGSDLKVSDLVRHPLWMAIEDERDTPGGFYAWDANSRQLLVVGAFLDGSPQTYSSLVALVDEQLPIQTATVAPTQPVLDPLPTFTWEPGELATAMLS